MVVPPVRPLDSIPASTRLGEPSLLAAIRLSGIVLVLFILVAAALYLALDRVWIAPAQARVLHAASLFKEFDDLQFSLVEERLMRARPGIARAPEGSAGAASLGETVARAERELRDLRDASTRAGLDESMRAPLEVMARGLYDWRHVVEAGGFDAGRAAYEPVDAAARDAIASIQQELTDRSEALDRAVSERAAVLIVLGVLGGILAVGATMLTMRRTRNALRRIEDHVAALERGELSPRELRSFAEITDVVRRLNELGRVLDRSRGETRRERESARARQADLELAQDLVLELSRARNEAHMVEIFARKSNAILGTSRVEVFRLVQPEGFLEQIGAAGDGERPQRLRVIEDPEACAAGRAALDAPGRGVVATHCPATPPCGGAKVCVPMIGASGRAGVVHFLAREGQEATAIRGDLGATLVRLLTPALENVRLLRESIERSATDPLTGIANRRRLEEFGTKQLALSVRQGLPFCVAALDVDRFKEINDRFGHDGGDRALVVVARALRGCVRETDLASRLGGDEFALLLPGSSAADAVRVVDRIRELLEDRQRTGLPHVVRVSAGVAECPPRGATLSELLGLADHALYTAKQERDATRVEPPPEAFESSGDRPVGEARAESARGVEPPRA